MPSRLKRRTYATPHRLTECLRFASYSLLVHLHEQEQLCLLGSRQEPFLLLLQQHTEAPILLGSHLECRQS